MKVSCSGLVTSDMFENELTLHSLVPGRKIRINVYTAGPFSTETVNGQAVLESDHLARNGVIHVLYSVMDSVYPMPGSVVGELQQCCPGTTQLLSFVHLSGLYQVMDRTEPVTLRDDHEGRAQAGGVPPSLTGVAQ